MPITRLSGAPQGHHLFHVRGLERPEVQVCQGDARHLLGREALVHPRLARAPAKWSLEVLALSRGTLAADRSGMALDLRRLRA